MSTVMDEKEMKALAKSLAKNIKTEKDLSDFSRLLKKMTVEAALGAELDQLATKPENIDYFLPWNVKLYMKYVVVFYVTLTFNVISTTHSGRLIY